MKIFFLLLLLPLASFVSSDMDYSIMPENSIAIVVDNAEELQLLEVDKARFSSGENLSKLSFKGIETSTKIKKGTPLKIFTRGGSLGQSMTFSIVKLEVDEKKRFAAYNSISGKKIKTFPYQMKQIDAKNQIYSLTPNSELEVGVYALIFKNVASGNFTMTGGVRLRTNPSVIEIVE